MFFQKNFFVLSKKSTKNIITTKIFQLKLTNQTIIPNSIGPISMRRQVKAKKSIKNISQTAENRALLNSFHEPDHTIVCSESLKTVSPTSSFSFLSPDYFTYPHLYARKREKKEREREGKTLALMGFSTGTATLLPPAQEF